MGDSRSAVFAATDRHGRDLVLKLPAARSDGGDPAAAEAAALSIWGAAGAAATLVDATSDALLLVRARPGVSWPWTPADVLDDLIAVAADLLARLWFQPVDTYRFPTLTEIYPERELVAREDAAVEQRERGEPDRGTTPPLPRHPPYGAGRPSTGVSQDVRSTARLCISRPVIEVDVGGCLGVLVVEAIARARL